MGESLERPGDSAVRVLICDDNAPLRAAVREVVELRPWLRVVGEAADGNEAVVEAKKLQPDVILLDLSMPNRTGLEALQELKQVAPGAKVIIFSGFSEGTAAEEAMELGADLYLQKGANADAINDAIEEAAAGLSTTGSRRSMRPSAGAPAERAASSSVTSPTSARYRPE
jgi:DNA-binding NarL/FixJ family response regulator